MASAQEIAARIAREEGGDFPRTEWPTRAEDKPKNSWIPNRKVVSGAIAGVVAVGTAYLAQHQGIELDSAGVSVVTASLMAIVGYFVPLKD